MNIFTVMFYNILRSSYALDGSISLCLAMKQTHNTLLTRPLFATCAHSRHRIHMTQHSAEALPVPRRELERGGRGGGSM